MVDFFFAVSHRKGVNNTVDGRDPAPVDMENFVGFHR